MIKRRASFTVFALTVGILTVVGALLYFLHGRQVLATVKSLSREAAASEAAGDYVKATEKYQLALGLKRDDPALLVERALCYSKLAASPDMRRAAITYLAKAQGVAPKEQGQLLRAEVGEHYVKLGEFVEARDQAEGLIKPSPESQLKPSPEKGYRLLALASVGLFENGTLPDGKVLIPSNDGPAVEATILSTLLEAKKLNATDDQIIATLANVYRLYPLIVEVELPGIAEKDRIGNANDVVDSFVRDYPENPKALLTRAVYRKQFALSGAEEDARKAIDLADNDRSVLRAAFFVLLPTDKAQPNEYAEAIELGERILKEGPVRDLDVILPLGVAYFESGDTGKAIDTWKRGKAATKYAPHQFTFLAKIADAQIETESVAELKATMEEANNVLDQAILQLSSEEVRRLRGAHKIREYMLRMLEGDTEQVLPELHKVASQGTPDDVSTNLKLVYLIAETHAKSGAYAEAAKAFDQAVELHPLIAELQASAGRAWAAAGQFADARSRFAAAMNRAKTPEAVIEYASLLIDSINKSGLARVGDKQLEGEVVALNQKLAELEGNADTQISEKHRWRVPAIRSEWKRLQRVIKEGYKTNSTTDDGLADLQEVEKRGENVPDALSFLCISYETRNQPTEADRILAKLVEIGPNTSVRYTTELQLATARKDSARILEVFGKMTSVATPAERAQLVSYLSTRLRQGQQFEGGQKGVEVARQLVVTEIDRNPENASLWKLLVDIDLERRDAAGIARTTEQLATSPLADKTPLLYARIFRALVSPKQSQKELQSALVDQKQFAALKPGSSEAETLRGLVEQQLGNNSSKVGHSAEALKHFEAATNAYENAIKGDERRLFVYEKLLELLPRVGRDSDMSNYLPRDEFIRAASPKLTEVIALQHYRNGEVEMAIAQAKRCSELRSKDVSPRLLLARLYSLDSRIDEADQAFANALSLSEENARVWEEYFEFRLRRRDQAAAMELLDRLQKSNQLAPANKLPTLARCYELLGDREKANKLYKEALALSPESVDLLLRYASFQSRVDPKAATSLLRDVLAKSPENLAVMRSLASVLSSQDDAAFAEAEKMLMAGNLSDPDIAENRRTLVRLYAQRGGRANIEKAVKVADEVAIANPNRDADRLELAGVKEKLAKYATDPKTRSEQMAAAKKVLEAAVAETPYDATSQQRIKRLMNLAQFAVRQGDADAGAKLAEVEKELDKGLPEDVELITNFITLCAGARRSDNWRKWADYLAKIDGNPIRPAAMRAKFLVLEGKVDQVAAILDPALENALNSTKVKSQRLAKLETAGRIYADLQLHKEAAAWFAKLVQEDPSRYDLLAVSQAKAGKLKEALDICHARYRETKDLTILYAMTDLVSTHGKSDGAIKMIRDLVQQAMAKEQRNVKLMESAAVLEFLSGKHEESERLLREALALAPRDVSILNNLACVLADKGTKLDEAVTFIDKAIEIQSAEAPLLDTKGIVLLAKENVAQALPLLELSTSPPNKDPRHHLHLAVAYQMSGKEDDSKKQAAIAKELGIDALTLTPLDARYLKKVATANSNGS